MPFTLSHAAAVLPLTTGRPARHLVPAGLVIGSWIPDLPYFVPFLHGADWSHSASGPVTIDLVLGLAVFLVWQLVLRRPLVDLAPHWVAARVPAALSLTVRRLGWAALSVVLGATTHVLWDTFSHRDRWGTNHVPWLNLLIGPLPAYKWFQFASGAGGLAIVAVWLLLYVRRTPARPLESATSDRVRRLTWVGLVAVFLVAIGSTWWLGAQLGGSVETVAFGVATGSIGIALVAVLAVCLIWQGRRVLTA